MTPDITPQKIARSDLYRYRDAKRSINDLRDKIGNLTSRINSCTATLQADIVQGGEKQSREDLIGTLIDLRQEYSRQQAQAERTMYDIEMIISEITDGLQKRILRNHYLYGQKFENISVNEHICYRTIKLCHQRGLRSYANILAVFNPEGYAEIEAEISKQY